MTESVFPSPASGGIASSDRWKPNRSLSKLSQKIVVIVFGAFAMVSVFTTFGIIFTLLFETIEFFLEVSPLHFFTSTRWTALFADPSFGVIVLMCGTFLTSVIGLLIAIPLGLLAAVCLSEYAPRKLRAWLKPGLEVLAGVPTVVFGYFALLMVTPVLQAVIPGLSVFNALSAGIVLGFAILPTIASLSEDAIFAVPQSLRQGSYAVGATKRETITGVVLPAALSGIVSSIILGVARAVGRP
jgi:phosphate transport system permease protein